MGQKIQTGGFFCFWRERSRWKETGVKEATGKSEASPR